MDNINLQTMQKREKKKFLSMDLAERMMRIEQSVGASFNKYIPYQQTEYYKSLSSEEKLCFKKYLANKKLKKLILAFIALFPVVLLFIFQFNFTGNVVKESLEEEMSMTLEIILIVVILISFYFLLHIILLNKKHEQNFVKHLSVLQNYLKNK